MSNQYDATKVGQQAVVLGGAHTAAGLVDLYSNSGRGAPVPAGSIAYTKDAGPQMFNGANWQSSGSGATTAVGASRNLTPADNGLTLECTATGISLTVPTGLGPNFGCAVIPKGTTSIVSAGGALLNAATSTISRTDTSNFIFAIVPRTAADSYVVTGS